MGSSHAGQSLLKTERQGEDDGLAFAPCSQPWQRNLTRLGTRKVASPAGQASKCNLARSFSRSDVRPTKKSILKKRGALPRMIRRPFVFPGLWKSKVRPHVTFNESVDVLEHERSLRDSGGVPSDGTNVTLGLGMLVQVTQQALASGDEQGLEDYWKTPEDRMTLLKDAMGSECYDEAWELHSCEMMELRKQRQETMLFDSDWSLMPPNLAEALRRAARLADDDKRDDVADVPLTKAMCRAKEVAHKISHFKTAAKSPACNKVRPARLKTVQPRFKFKLWTAGVSLLRMRSRAVQKARILENE